MPEVIKSTFSMVPPEMALDDRLTKMQLRVLIALLSFRNKNTDTVWPKREQLKECCGYDVRTISRVTGQLEKLGWLEKEGKGGFSKSCDYRITVPDLSKVSCETVSEVATVAEPETVAEPDTSRAQDVVGADDTGPKTVSEPDTVAESATVAEPGTKTVSEVDTSTVAEPDTRKEQTIEHTNEQTSSNTTAGQGYFSMYPDWKPSELAFQLTDRRGVNRSFAEDSVPEFVLYWCGRGDSHSNAWAGGWDQRFFKHCIKQWVKYQAALEHDSAPRLIPEDYSPTEAVCAVLADAEISIDFAHSLVPEFILYWRERKEVSSSWNTKFLQHVKWRWAHRHEDQGDFVSKITDRSWAA